jgi:hypothetical protein
LRDRPYDRFSDDGANTVERPGAFYSTRWLFESVPQFLKRFPEAQACHSSATALYLNGESLLVDGSVTHTS